MVVWLGLEKRTFGEREGECKKVCGRGSKREKGVRERGSKKEREIEKHQDYLLCKRTTLSRPVKNNVFGKANRTKDIDKETPSSCVIFKGTRNARKE